MRSHTSSPIEDASRLVVTSATYQPELKVLSIAGEVDMATAPVLRDELERHLVGATGRVIVDLSDVPFLASSGLAVLVEVDAQCRNSGIRLDLVAPHRATRRPFEATGLTDVLNIHADRDAALAARPSGSAS